LEFALKETQTKFYALNLQTLAAEQFSPDDTYNLLKLPVKEADKDGSLLYISSTYDPVDPVLLEGYYPGTNRKVITFSGVLQSDVFPLAGILDYILQSGEEEMGRPVEIEFAVNLEKDREKELSGAFYLLQIRPIVDSKEMMNEDLTSIRKEDVLLYSGHALGHGIANDVFDVIYVKTERFNAANNPVIASEIEKWNNEMMDEGKSYILIGPGRWGSADPWLGIPVKWTHISNARVIVEAGLKNYRIEPSQGTHFFQNLTSFGVGYFTVNPHIPEEGVFDEAFLNRQAAFRETKFLRHVRFDKPAVIKIDGRKNTGVVMKP
jgi:hypothetical protein